MTCEAQTFDASIPQNVGGSTPPRLLAIFVSPMMGAEMKGLTSVTAVEGKGLKQDRYYKNEGAFSVGDSGKKGSLDDEQRQVSIISLEAIIKANAHLRARNLATYTAPETRRNLVVSASTEDLRKLKGQQFAIGGVLFEWAFHCGPCRRPAILLERGRDAAEEFDKALPDGGIRAKVIQGGRLRVGARVRFSTTLAA